MKRILLLAALLGLVMLAFSAPLGLLPFETSESRIDRPLLEQMNSGDQEIPFIVMFKPGFIPSEDDLEEDGAVVDHCYHLIHGASARGSAEAVRKVAGEEWAESLHLDGRVSVAQPDQSLAVGEPVCPSQQVNASGLWQQGINGSGVIVAVIDSGIDKNHPDLAGRIVGEKNFVEGEDTTDDLLGHGTMCAGIIAGSGAASGGRYRGVAPMASLLNVRVIASDGNGRVSDIIAGIEWALDNNAQILSLSLAGLNLGETNPPVTMAADNAMEAGVVVCVAAGNNG
ncbi:MAG: Halolysin precursor [Methanosaeta sp. PtaU1.Bin028]|nr:MAG: Halolysin precursor [Methanosaeta sp. PtaU1.Bin028]